MDYKKGILLGRIIKVKGSDGVVTVKLDKYFTGDIKDMEPVFLELEGKPVPFFISFSEFCGASLLKIMFEGYDSMAKVKDLAGCNIYLTTSAGKEEMTADIQDLINYKVFTEGDKLLGTVSGIILNPGQWLLNVLSAGNKEVLVPFHEDFIVSVDRKKKILCLELPEGLVELN